MNKADIGFIGLAVMGENLVMNMESHGFTVAVFNRTLSKVDNFINGRALGKNIIGTYSLSELVSKLTVPRKVFVMVKAGEAVDNLINELIPLLDDGDIIIDGGNSYFVDTMRRTKYVESTGKLYVGAGISGGEEGALNGPSIMPGGSREAWPFLEPIFHAICAKTQDGHPCCEWIGGDGAGHFVKMVHNGIEYGDMQLISEAYSILRDYIGLSADEAGEIFKAWNKGELDSYLIQITGDILRFKDEDNMPLIDKIQDIAMQKGTGKWVGIEALDEGAPLTLIVESVFARYLSKVKEERKAAASIYNKQNNKFSGSEDEKSKLIELVKEALYASKIISYAQGFALMWMAAKKYDWKLNFGEIALIWRGGCIIRSVFLGRIKEAYDRNADLENLLLDEYFKDEIQERIESWRKLVSIAVTTGIPVPAMASALTYFDGYTTECSSANLIQAQRDYFGAHTYQRIDCPDDKFFHTDWTGHGGQTTAGVYLV